VRRTLDLRRLLGAVVGVHRGGQWDQDTVSTKRGLAQLPNALLKIWMQVWVRPGGTAA
jgi:hypothetical protein